MMGKKDEEDELGIGDDDKPATSDKKSRPNRKREEDDALDDVQGIASAQLRSIVERIERLEEEKKAIADDIKEVYGEAKGNGYDTKVLRKIISLRKQDASEREEQEALLDVYKQALGMV
jgi:uncharacterized protein (UPF0335 family)